MADKVREREFVQSASARFGWHPVTIRDRESPDFELEFAGGRTVGLEVAEAVDEGVASGQPSMGRFCLSLKDRLVAKQVPVYAHVSFFEACSELIAPVTTKRAHVDALANLICSNVPGDGVAVDFEEDELQAAGAPYIKRLSIRRSDQPRITSGHTGSGRGFVFLDEKIRRKDDQLGRYRLNLPDADAFWLLMVAGTVHGGVLPQTATQYAYPTLFNRVFYFDLQRDIALELETTRRREGSTS